GKLTPATERRNDNSRPPRPLQRLHSRVAASMTQHMGMMDFSDEEELDDELGEKSVGYLQLLPPHDDTLSWVSKEFKDGETTIGRTDDQDITIADPSVSGNHAIIDVVDLPGGGGKRLTLKDLRSTNGTYVVDAETGTKTRLAPKKATMLPEEGCRVHFGGVACKVAMGPAPEVSPAAANAAAEDEQAAAAGIYENDTQMPGVIDIDDDEDDTDGGNLDHPNSGGGG
ncbi:unnamed protein product, partial [Scytosiphon promiscuus]